MWLANILIIYWYVVRRAPVFEQKQIEMGVAQLRSQKSRQNPRSYVWTEALVSGMIFVPARKLSSIVWT